jgi:colanic acid/amylovoran biosynthesis glycosyltransferase
MTTTRRIAYVMTHYPNPSHTFLQQEILRMRDEGFDIVPVAINEAAERDLLTDLDRSEHDRTFYVKATPKLAALRAVMSMVARRPLPTIRFFAWAARQGGTDPERIVKRSLQAVEAVVLLDEVRRRGIQHLHGHFAGSPAFVTWFTVELARRLADGPPLTWSLTVHGPHDFMNERSAGLPEVTAHADLVVAITDYTAAQLMRLSPPDRRSRVAVVRCGIDLDRFPRRAPVDTAPDGGIRLLNVGRMAPEKGQWVLIDAMAELVKRGVDAQLRIIGSGELRDEIERQCAERGVTDRVELVGVVPPERVRAELEQTDVYCMPSFAEGLPISIMEACAVGVPVVCTSIAGIPELVIDGVTGHCVPAGSVTGFADAIEHIANDPAFRDRVVDAARARVEQRHDSTTSARELAALFHAVIDGQEATTR